MIQLTLEGKKELKEQTIDSLKKTKDKVAQILEKYPATKGDDRLLQFYFYKEFEPDKVKLSFKKFKMLMLMTSPETIRRVRQKLNEEGKFLPTDKTILKRRRRESIVRQNICGV
jgi:hypothetical protein